MLLKERLVDGGSILSRGVVELGSNKTNAQGEQNSSQREHCRMLRRS